MNAVAVLKLSSLKGDRERTLIAQYLYTYNRCITQWNVYMETSYIFFYNLLTKFSCNQFGKAFYSF